MSEFNRLYSTLKDPKYDLLSVSINEFAELFKDSEYKEKVFNAIIDNDLYSGDFNQFQEQFTALDIDTDTDIDTDIEKEKTTLTKYNPKEWGVDRGFIELNDPELKGAKFTKANFDNIINDRKYAPYIDKNGVLDITKVPDELKREMLLEANANKDIPATLVRKSEGEVVALLEEKYPALKGRFNTAFGGWGNVNHIRVDLMNGQNLDIDLSDTWWNDEDKATEVLEQLDKWYTNINEKKLGTINHLLDTNWRSTGKGWVESLPELTQQFEKIGYSLETGRVTNILRKEGKEVFRFNETEGRELSEFLMNNLSENEINTLLEGNIESYSALAEALEKERERLRKNINAGDLEEDIIDNDIIINSFKDDSFLNTLVRGAENAGMSKDGIEKLKNILTSSEILPRQESLNTALKSEYDYDEIKALNAENETIQLRNKERNENAYNYFLKNFINTINDPENGLSEEDKNILLSEIGDKSLFKNTLATINQNSKEELINRKVLLFSEKLAREDGAIRLGVWAKKIELDEKLSDIKSLTNSLTLDQKTFNITIENEFNNIANIAKKNGWGFSVDVDGDEQYIVKEVNGSDAFKSRVSRLVKTINYKINEQEAAILNITESADNYDLEHGEFQRIREIASKEYDLGDIMMNDFGSAVSEMLLSIPSLLGSDWAQSNMADLNLKKERNYETHRTWDEAALGGVRDRWFWRNGAQQSPNVILAIGTVGYGTSLLAPRAALGLQTFRGGRVISSLSPAYRKKVLKNLSKEKLKQANEIAQKWAMNLVATEFGLISAGSKANQLSMEQDARITALDTRKWLIANKDKLSYEDWANQMINVDKTIALGDMTWGEKAAAVIFTGLTEGVITRFFGTIPNAAKQIKNWTGAISGKLAQGYTTGLQNAANTIGLGAWQIGSEVIEETGIEFGTVLGDGLILGRDFDFSQMKDVAMSSIMIAGPMNGPGTAYSGILNHVYNASSRQEVNQIKAEIESVEKWYKNLLSKKVGIGNQQLTQEETELFYEKWNNIANKAAHVTKGLEIDAMLLNKNGKGIGRLFKNERILKELYEEAGVNHNDPVGVRNAKIKLYHRKLTETEVKQWNARREAAEKSSREIVESIDYNGKVEEIFGQTGLDIIAGKVTKEDKNGKITTRIYEAKKALYKGLKGRELLIKVADEVKKQADINLIEKTKSNFTNREAVEKEIYGQAFETSGKKRRNLKLENSYYLNLGKWNTKTKEDFDQDFKAVKQFYKQAGKDVKDYQVISDPKKFKEAFKNAFPKEDSTGIENENGFYDDKTKRLYINKPVAIFQGAKNTSSHEFLHFLVSPLLRKYKGNLTKQSLKLIDGFKKRLSADDLKIVEDRLEARGYFKRDKNGKIIGDEQVYAEEYLTQFFEGIRDGEIKFNKTIFDKILEWFKKLFDINTEYTFKGIKDGREFYDFIREYATNVEEGKLNKSFVTLAKKSDTKKIKKAKPKKSLTPQENKILADKKALSVKTGDVSSFLKDPAVKTHIEMVTNSAFKKFYRGDVPNYVDAETYKDSARTDLSIIALDWKPEKASFDKYIANRGMQRLNSLATDLGVPSSQEMGGMGYTTSLEDAKDVAVYMKQFDDNPFNSKETKELNSLVDLGLMTDINADNITDRRVYRAVIDFLKTDFADYNIVTRNRKVTLFIAGLKKFLGNKKGDAFHAIKAFMGKKDALKAFLKKNKNVILKTATTTWLSKNYPKVILKSVGGKWRVDMEGKLVEDDKGNNIFDPNWVDYDVWSNVDPSKWDEEKSTKGGPTSGPQLMKRSTDAIKDTSPTEFSGNFFKPNGNVDQSKQESIAQHITQEYGMDLFRSDLNKKDENGQPVGPLFGLFRNKQQELKRQVQDNATEELNKQLDRGTVKMSKTVRDFTPLKQKIFGQNLDDVAKKLENGDNINKAIYDVYGDLGFTKTDIAGLIKDFNKLLNLHEDWAKQYEKVGVKFQPITKFLIDNIKNFDTKVNDYLNVKESRAKLYDDKNRIITARRVPLDYANHLLEAKDKKGKLLYTKEQVVKSIIKWHKNYLTSAGKKIARGQFTVNEKGEIIEGKVPVFPKGHKKAGKPRTNRNQAFGTVEDFIKWTVNQIPGVEVNSLGKGIIDNKEVNLDITSPMQTVEEGMTITSEKSLEYAKEAREELKRFVGYLTNRVKEEAKKKKPKFDKADLSMQMAALNSGTTSLLRAAADVRWRYIPRKGRRKQEGKLRYEHMTPADFIGMKILDRYMNPNTKVDLDLVFDNYHVAMIPQDMDTVINDVGYKSRMTPDYLEGDVFPKRYYNIRTFGNKNIWAIKSIRPEDKGKIIGQPFVDIYNKSKSKKISTWEDVEQYAIQEQAKLNAYNVKQPKKGMSVLDFDDTLAITKSKIKYTIPRRFPDGRFNPAVVGWGAISDKGSLTPAEFAEQHDTLKDYGAVFDFSEFNKVIDGKPGPFLKKALELQKKFGSDNMFIVTARPAKAANAIHTFLRGVGLNIKVENIFGLEDGKPEAKASWIVEKYAEGYNDILFADDQLKNVKAVESVYEKFDIKGKVFQARSKLSRNASDTFNRILQESKGIKAEKEFSDVTAKARGYNLGKWQFFIPPSAEDFAGLMYPFLGKGKQGDKHMEWFEKTLFKPFARGIRDINQAKQRISNEYSALKKQHPDVSGILSKEADYNNFTYDTAVRVYLWNKNGIDIPGISKRDTNALVKIVKNNPELQTFADNLSIITRVKEGYVVPKNNWLGGTIELDVIELNTRVNRVKYLEEWINNKNLIFSKKNLNKIEANFGTSYRAAIEDILYRMENGTHRSQGQNAIVNEMQDWIAGSIGNIMFLNIRSATLQSISFINFMNWNDNNPLKAGVAFANQPQFWKDVMMIFKSDFLKQRRAGLQIDVNANEIATVVARSKNKFKTALAYLLQKGYTPTKIMDSFAIAFGGATMYRNRVNTYIKQGMSKKDAEKKAFLDMQEVAEKTQQSARPDLISEQQASIIGRVILNFTNVTMQYNRLSKKAVLDLINRRGDTKTNISKIIYYVAVQNVIFNGLQQALFALMFDDEDDEKTKARYFNLANGMADTLLRGMGIYGAIAATLKNMVIEFKKQEDKGYRADHAYTLIDGINVSPPLGSKARKFYSAANTWKYEKDVIYEMGFDIDNPGYDMFGNLISIATNAPTDRVMQKVDNVKVALDNQNSAWQRIAAALGWPAWQLGVEDKEVEKVKEKLKDNKKKKKKKSKTRW